jgi:hypothetical protein
LFDEIALWVANFGVPSFIFSLRVSESENHFKNKTWDSCISLNSAVFKPLNSAFQTIEFQAKYPRFVSQAARDWLELCDSIDYKILHTGFLINEVL